MNLQFQPLYFSDQIEVINPWGSVGLITLWSRTDYVLRRLERSGVDLSAATSPIAAVGTLYGNGLRELLRNLLYNPQIDTLILFGRNRSGSQEDLIAYFEEGLEPHESAHTGYAPTEDGMIPSSMRIRGRSRIIDSLIEPHHFPRLPSIVIFDPPQSPAAAEQVKEFLQTYQRRELSGCDRVRIPLPKVTVHSFPGNPRGHTILVDDPLSAWQEIVRLLTRFGQPVKLAKGDRRELQNLKVVVELPEGEAPSPELLRANGFDPVHLEQYQQNILNGALHGDETYTYGNRLRTYFGIDSLRAAVERLRADPEDRKSYVVLWDPRRDLTAAEGHPCLVSLFFRLFLERLTLTATFRTHNALDAWPINFYGLVAIQRYVADRCNMQPGAITVFSHSISLDCAQLDQANRIAGEARERRGYREDPMGYFKISLDADAILVQHRIADVTLHEYRHSKAARLQHQLHRDGAVSDINHAIYLGRQLARAEACLQNGEPFVQE